MEKTEDKHMAQREMELSGDVDGETGASLVSGAAMSMQANLPRVPGWKNEFVEQDAHAPKCAHTHYIHKAAHETTLVFFFAPYA